MGLDLYTKESGLTIKMGSYSGVHIFRRAVCEAYVRRAGDDHDQPKALVQFVGAVAPETGNKQIGCGIIYEMFDDPAALPSPSLETEEFRGLVAFVDHSDCDGEHTSDSLGPIVAMLDYVAPAFADSREWFDRVRNFYRAALQANDSVEFA